MIVVILNDVAIVWSVPMNYPVESRGGRVLVTNVATDDHVIISCPDPEEARVEHERRSQLKSRCTNIYSR
jgi:hypothetical protein